MVDFLVADLSPQLQGRDNNYSAGLYFAPKSRGLTMSSTAGWNRAAALDPGSYAVTNDTSTNATRLGTTRSKKKSHINQQDFTLAAGMPEITPFGEAVRLKTTMNVNPVTVAYATPTLFTVAVGGGGTQAITLESVTGLNTHIGKALQIPLSSGANLHTVYNAILERIDGTQIVLESALDDAPADAAEIRVVDYVEFEPGGAEMAEWGILAVISGDRGQKLVHHVKSAEVTEGNHAFAADNVGMATISLAINPETVVREGRKQDKFMTERIYYG